MRIQSIEVDGPEGISESIETVLEQAIHTNDMNLLVHIHDEMTWLFQGLESGEIDGRETFAQSTELESYSHDSVWRCADTQCSASFIPNSASNHIRWAVPLPDDMTPLSEGCATQVLELVNVEIALTMHIPVVLEDGYVSAPALTASIQGHLRHEMADQFMVDASTTLRDMSSTPSDPPSNGIDGWNIIIYATAEPTRLDNDFGAAINSTPRHTPMLSGSTGHDCR